MLGNLDQVCRIRGVVRVERHSEVFLCRIGVSRAMFVATAALDRHVWTICVLIAIFGANPPVVFASKGQTKRASMPLSKSEVFTNV